MAERDDRRGRAGRRPGRERPRTFKTDLREFQSLDLMGQLYVSYLAKRDPEITFYERRLLASHATVRALSATACERTALGVSVVAKGLRDQDGNIDLPHPEWQRYVVDVEFPYEGAPHRISTINSDLSSIGDNTEVGIDIVNARADIKRGETIYERFTRLFYEQLGINKALAEAINTDPPDENVLRILNYWKERRLLDYLRTAIGLREEYPQVQQELFRLEENTDSYANILLREGHFEAERGNEEESLRNAQMNINIQVRIDRLRERYGLFLQDPRHATQTLRRAADLCGILGIMPNQPQITPQTGPEPHRRATPSHAATPSGMEALVRAMKTTGEEDKAPMPQQEEITDETHASQPPQTEYVTRAARRRARKGPAQGSGYRTVELTDLASNVVGPEPAGPPSVEPPGERAEAVERTVTPAEILDRLQRTSSTDREQVNELIHMVLGLSSEQRNQIGVFVATTGREHLEDAFYKRYPDLLQYSVHVLFPADGTVGVHSSYRESLSQGVDAQEFEDSVENSSEAVAESTSDRYRRLLTELSVIDERRQRDERLVDTDREDVEVIRTRLKTYLPMRKGILVASLQTADELHAAFPLPHLYYVSTTHRDDQRNVAFLTFSEDETLALRLLGQNVVPSLQINEFTKEETVNVRNVSARDIAKRRGEVSDDMLLSQILIDATSHYLPQYENSIPLELVEFVTLPLHEQLRRTHQDYVRYHKTGSEGTPEYALMTAKRRVVMRNLLEASDEQREALGVEFSVVGSEKSGKLVIAEDLDLASYTLYMRYPYGDAKKKFVFEETRANLAGNPYTDAVPSLDELLFFDNIINASGIPIQTENGDRILPHNHLIQAIIQADRRIEEINDPGGETENQYMMRKLPYVLEFLQLALTTQGNYSEPFFMVEQTADPALVYLHLFPLEDWRLRMFLSGDITQPHRDVRRSEKSHATYLPVSDLLELKAASDGDEDTSNEARAASLIVDILGRDDTYVIPYEE